eukprot:TRINITY_DN31805_c0_g1_i1.p1 TRINITY_DN31805_c0_g1~~TRINITY_DN31805_c0_g1_i1.p1  ORF type:complete len:738 (+),score=258.68 TRINITY_DN31805_c0_g1_i1:176-2389(+)
MVSQNVCACRRFGLGQRVILLLALFAVSHEETCNERDFGISYQGNKVFSVSSQNNTCTCLNYASPGLAVLDTVNARLLTVGTLAAAASNGSISVPVGTVVDFAAGDASRQESAGKVGYGAFGYVGSLNIVGGGSSVGTRRVKVLDVLEAGTLVASGNYVCNGLEGTYYDTTNSASTQALTGQLLLADQAAVCTRTDAQLALLWEMVGNCGLCAGLGCGAWGARWKGHLLAPVTGALTLVLTFDDGMRFFWNGDVLPLMGTWSAAAGSKLANVTVSVTLGTYYPIVVEYFQSGGRFQLMMQWSYDSHGIELVPSANLCTARSVTAPAGALFGGFTTFNGPVLFSSGIGSFATPTTVHGGLTSSGLFVAKSQALFQSDVIVSGDTLIAGVTQAQGGLVVTGGTRINGTLAVGSALNVSGPTTVAALTASGTATLSTTKVTGAAGTVALSVTAAGGQPAATFSSGSVFMGAGATITSGSLSIPAGGGGLTVADLTTLGTTRITAGASAVGLNVNAANGMNAAMFNGAVQVVGALDVNGTITNGGFDFVLGNANQDARGNSAASRAVVKYTNNRLFLNYKADFGGGTVIDSNLTVSGITYFPQGIGNGASTLQLLSDAQIGGALTVTDTVTTVGLTSSGAVKVGAVGTPFRSVRAVSYNIGAGTSTIKLTVPYGVTYSLASKLFPLCTVVSSFGTIVSDSFSCTLQSISVSNLVAKIQRTDATSNWSDTTLTLNLLIYEQF